MTRGWAFLQDETGAVTVDFVVLTAAVVAMAMLIFPLLRTPVSSLAIYIADSVDEAHTFFEPPSE